MRWKSFVAIVLVLVFTSAPLAQAKQERTFEGAGTSIIPGGTGSPSFVPVTTMLGIHWDGETGRFDCLALAPSHLAGSSQSSRSSNLLP